MLEARALRDGLSVAIQVGYHNLIIEGDNKIVIQTLKGKIQMAWQIQHIIKDILTWQEQDVQFFTNYIFREANTAAD